MPAISLETVKRITLATALAAVCWAIPGCQSITPTTTYSLIRFIDASPDAPGLDMYQGNTVDVYNLGFGSVTSYIPTSPGTYRFSAYSAGTKQSLISTSAGIATGTQYTVMVSNIDANLEEKVFPDQSQSAPSGQIAIRIINEATQSGPYDVYMVPSGVKLINVNPIATDVTFDTVGSYINIPTSSYSIEILPTGTTLTSTTVATYSSALTPYTAGSAHTFLILDQQIITTPGAQVLIIDDYEPPGSVAAN